MAPFTARCETGSVAGFSERPSQRDRVCLVAIEQAVTVSHPEVPMQTTSCGSGR